MSETKLNYRDQLGKVRFIKPSSVYVEKDTELWWSIRPSVVNDENQTRQLIDR